MLGLQDDPCIAFGVAAIHTAVRPSHDGFEASAEFAPDEVAPRSSKSAGERFPNR